MTSGMSVQKRLCHDTGDGGGVDEAAGRIKLHSVLHLWSGLHSTLEDIEIQFATLEAQGGLLQQSSTSDYGTERSQLGQASHISFSLKRVAKQATISSAANHMLISQETTLLIPAYSPSFLLDHWPSS